MFDIELGENGDILCSGRLDAAECTKAQDFMDSISGSKHKNVSSRVARG